MTKEGQKKPRRLTMLQRKTADIYLTQGVSKREAAKIAGYKGDDEVRRVSASRALASPQVIEYIERQYKEISQDLGIDLKWRCQKLKYIIEKNLESDLFGDHRIALLALDMLNKMADSYPRKEDKGVTVNVVEIREARVALEEALEKNRKDY